MTNESVPILVRGSVLHFLRDPGVTDDPGAWQYLADGALLIEGGRIVCCAGWEAVMKGLPDADQLAARYFDYRGKLIVPGFVDTHAHYPQLQVMGSFGRQLLDWLRDYTFPAEAGFSERAVADRAADFFLERMLAHGTTTAAVFATVHSHSVDAFFEAALARRLRVLCGKVMMDRNCPENLRDTAASSRQQSIALIERWHGRERLRYAVTPRFAPTSSAAQLQAAGELFQGWPDMHLQSHLSENRQELAWVASLFPGRKNYVDVYEHFGLLGQRAIYGHGIHLDDGERCHLAQTGTAIAFCPTSNRFLGSGLFDYGAVHAAGVRVGLATDVGGGTSLSMLRTMAAAYEVCQARAQPLSAWRAWYLATLGGAQALALDAFIGNFTPGKEADFTVLDFEAVPELAWRAACAQTLEERLFALMMLGDDRCVAATHVLGEPVGVA